MPPAEMQCDPERLLRDAIAAIAVAAYARGINVMAHVDNRLPGALAPVAADVDGFLRRGLQRMIEAGHTGKIALALWFEAAPPGGEPQAVLEVCRALDPAGPAVSGLADIWALPLGGGTARPRPGRQDETVESVLIPLAAARPGMPEVAERWGAVFRGRRLLHLRDVLFDQSRLEASMARIGTELGFTRSADAALAMLRADARAGRPFDAALIDGHALGPGAVVLARQVRGDPSLAGTRLVLASAVRGPAPAAEDMALFDVTPWSAAPWRRLIDVLHDLFRSAESPTASPPAAETAAAIPVLAGRRIIVAEDVATNQVLLRAVLAPTGAAIEIAPDGAATVALHRAAPADLIVMDLQMPGIGGIAALREIRALDGAAGAVPVVALTAYARGDDRRKALAAGMDAFLAKPIVVAEFYRLLRRFLLPCPETG